MLRYILSLLFVVSLISYSHSQEFNAGFFGGMATSQISGDNLQGFNKVGIYAGGLVNRYFNDKMGVQLEIDFIQKGSRHNPDPENNDYSSYLLRLNYLEVPIIFKYEYNKLFGFEIGPSIGYLLSFVEDVNDGDPYISKEFINTEFAIMGGFVYKFVKDMRLVVRYSNSIFPVRKHASDQEYRLNKGQYNMVLSFTIAKQFNFNQ